MNVAFLSGGTSIHTIRWVNAVAARGIETHLLTLHRPTERLDPNVSLHTLPLPAPLGYFLSKRHLQKKLREIQPDLLHVHYASGYGTLSRLCGFRPCLLSVWGSDVYDFPYESSFKRRLLEKNLHFPDHVSSTSHCMAEQTRSIVDLKDISVVPFGVDTEKFRPGRKSDDDLVIGTVKTLASKYGIDTLIQGFGKLLGRNSIKPFHNKLKLRIAGGGPDRQKLENLVATLGLKEKVEFLGAVPHEKVPEVLQSLDIFAQVSRLDSESFGVAVIEASACELAVVVSSVGGLPEVVRRDETGLIVPKEDPSALADALEKLVLDPEFRGRLAKKGREFVQSQYEWEKNVDQMIDVYRLTIEKHKGSV